MEKNNKNQHQVKFNKISKNDLLSDIEKNCPQALILLAEYGLHCIGCFAMQFETLEQGAKAHGMIDLEIEKMVEEVNNKLNK